MSKRGRHKKFCECEKCQLRKISQENIEVKTDETSIYDEGRIHDNILFDKLSQIEKETQEHIEQEREKEGIGIEKIILRGSFFIMIGQRLKKMTGEEGYLLTDEEASSLCETVVECLKAMDYRIHPAWVLIISLGVWLGLPTLSFLYKHRDKFKNITFNLFNKKNNTEGRY